MSGVLVSVSSARNERVIAIVQAAGQRVGIEGRHVRQAVEVPADMAGVPRRAGGIVGMIVQGTQLVPVVRLENWLDSDAAPAAAMSADARIVIVGDGDRVVGLLVEAIVGMQRCAVDAVVRLFHDERPDELFACAARLGDGEAPLALLDPARLTALAGVWCAAAGLETTAPATPRDDVLVQVDAVDAPTERVDLAMLRIGDRLVGVDVTHIGELLPIPALRPPPLRHPTTRGLSDWRDRLLPVVDIGGLLGASAGGSAPAWMCVVREGAFVLGVLVHQIVELHAADLPVAMPGGLVRCELPTEHGILQVLDGAALMAACPESAISARGDRAHAAASGVVTSPHTWLVFEAAGVHAARIEHVQEIIPLPDALRPRLDAGLDVSLPWRGQAVPVRPLFADAPLAPAQARLLVVVVSAQGCVAVPITAVKAMIAPRTATLSRLRVRAESVEVISTVGADRATYEVADLEARAGAELRQAA